VSVQPTRGLRTLLIDLDGTLTDNFVGISRSIGHALAALGAPLDDLDSLRTCVGPPLRHSFARLLGDPDAAAIERAISLYRERFGDLGWAENTVYDGMVETVATLAARGHVLHLCTSKPQPYAQRIVERFGFAQHLAGVYGADLAGTLDDKSKLVAHVLSHEGLKASDCAMIGDREHDIRAARNNGVAAIGVLWGYGSRAELEAAGADAIIEFPAALFAAIARLDARD
jgi:phosphoglycolate phosphatase